MQHGHELPSIQVPSLLSPEAVGVMSLAVVPLEFAVQFKVFVVTFVAWIDVFESIPDLIVGEGLGHIGED